MFKKHHQLRINNGNTNPSGVLISFDLDALHDFRYGKLLANILQTTNIKLQGIGNDLDSVYFPLQLVLQFVSNFGIRKLVD